MRHLFLVAVLAGVLAIPNGAAALPAGSLDPSFAGTGFLREDLFPTVDEAPSGIADDGGKTVVVGAIDTGNTVFVARFNPDGTPDASFDGDGVRTWASDGPPAGVAVQSNGRILVLYEHSNHWIVRGLTDTGADDNGFGVNSTFDQPMSGTPRAIALDGDKVLVAGDDNDRFAIVRLTAFGSIDPTFNGGAVASVDASPGTASGAYAVAPGPDGAIVAAGFALPGGASRMAVIRLTKAGQPDTSFSGDGLQLIDLGGTTFIPSGAVGVLPDGRVIYLGYVDKSSGVLVSTIVRLKADGDPDDTWAGTGIVRLRDGLGVNGLLLQPDGKLLGSGAQFSGVAPTVQIPSAVVRVDGDGNLDSSFGDSGILENPVDEGIVEGATVMAPAADGRVLTAGVFQNFDAAGDHADTELYFERFLTAPDNCPLIVNDQADLDGDGIGDVCDDDIDGDGLPNAVESALGTDQRVTDSDGDGKRDGHDACPTLAGTLDNGCPAPSAPTTIVQTNTVTLPPLTTPSADKTAAKLALRLAKTLKRTTFMKKGLSLKLASNEPVRVEAQLIGTLKGARVARVGDVVLAQKNLPLAGGNRTIKFKLSARARKLIGKTAKLTVRITAFDATGNRTIASKTIRIK